MLDDDASADVTLTCDDGNSMKCHRAILTMYSAVIQRMLSPDFVEGRNNQITFIDISLSLLSKVVRFLCGDDLQVSGKDVLPLLQFGDMYDITVLQEVCGKMFMRHIKAGPVVLSLWSVAKRYNASTLHAAVQAYCVENISRHIRELDQKHGYLKADKDMVIEVLSDPKLRTATEKEVFEAIIKWAMFKQEDRASDVKEILEKCVRSDMLSPHAIYATLNTDDVVSNLQDSFKQPCLAIRPTCSELTSSRKKPYQRACTHKKLPR